MSCHGAGHFQILFCTQAWLSPSPLMLQSECIWELRSPSPWEPTPTPGSFVPAKKVTSSQEFLSVCFGPHGLPRGFPVRIRWILDVTYLE